MSLNLDQNEAITVGTLCNFNGTRYVITDVKMDRNGIETVFMQNNSGIRVYWELPVTEYYACKVRAETVASKSLTSLA